MASTRQEKPDTGRRYAVKHQRVKQVDLSVEKDGVYERPGPSWTSVKEERRRAEQAEPWNVEDVKITGRGIKVSQYGAWYDHNQSRRGPVILGHDKIAWDVLFKSQSMKDICVREWTPLDSSDIPKMPTFIELGFQYEGLPESKDATQLATTEGTPGAEGTEMEEEEAKMKEGAEAEKAEREEEVDEDDVAEGDAEDDEEAEDEDAEEMEDEEDISPVADQFDLAKLFAGPTNSSVLKVRIAFVRLPTKRQRYQWIWPATFAFLRGLEAWTPKNKKADTEYRVGLPLDRWMNDFGNNYGAFIAQPQEDKTTRWLMKPKFDRQQQRQRPSIAGPAVPAFGAPLPVAPKPTSTPTPTPTPESSQGSRKRTLENVEAEEDELEQERKRVIDDFEARRKRLREERRGVYH